MNKSSSSGQSMILSDGRKLGFMEYGILSGTPVFLFHGSAGSRLWFVDDDPVSVSLGVRLITTDRPGYGISDYKKDRTIIDWSDDINELADHLSIDNYYVIGWAGGAAYAAACAYQRPANIRAAVLISCQAPINARISHNELSLANRIVIFLQNVLPRYAPWLLSRMVAAKAKMINNDPLKYLETNLKQLSESDRKLLRDEKTMVKIIQHIREAYRNGIDAQIKEIELAGKPWGFELKDITIPVHVWHGEEDKIIPASMASYFIESIPDCTSHIIPDVGHLLVDDEEQWKDILLTLIGSKEN